MTDMLRRCGSGRKLRQVLESLEDEQARELNRAAMLAVARRLIRRGVLDPQPEQPRKGTT